MVPLEAPQVAAPARERGLASVGNPAVADDVFLFPTSFQQRRLWFLEHLHPCGSAYSLPIVLRVTGRLETGALEWTLNEIVRRHEVLRTTFALREDEPVQLIWPGRSVELLSTSLAGQPKAERERRALEAIAAEARRPFDLSHGPLFRAHLWRLEADDHFLLLNMHHAVADGWSFGVLMRELAALYEAFRQGRPSPLSALTVQYADYAEWQRQWLQGEVVERLAGYWRQQLEGAQTVLELPADHPHPVAPTFRGAYETALFPEELTRSIHEFSRRQGVTPYMCTLAGFAALLFRYTGRTDLVIGSPIANRAQAGVAELIGLFANTLALRLDLSGCPTFRRLLSRVRETAISAYAHQEMPFERLVEELNPVRGASHNPLFQVMFLHQQAFLSPLCLPEVTFQPVILDRGGSLADLTLFIIERKEGLRAGFEFKTDLFETATIRRMLEHLQTLLASAVSDPDRQVSRLLLLPRDERRQSLSIARGQDVPLPAFQAVHELFQSRVDEIPDAVAVTTDGGESLTYQQLNERANRLAHYLLAQGVGPDVPVGVCLHRSAEAVTAILGILKAGGAYLPLDPTYPADRLQYMIHDSRAPLLLTLRAFAGRFARGSARIVSLDRLERALRRQNSAPPPIRSMPENLAYVIYTSGSTGRPKGVLLPHRALSNHMEWMQAQFPVSREDRIVQRTPLSFDASVWELFLPLVGGARLVIPEAEAHRDPGALVRSIQRNAATVVQTVPPLLGLLLEEPELPLCVSLRHVFCGGGPIPVALQERFFERLPAALHNLYGPTEATIDASFWTCRRQAVGESTVPIGKPIANSQIYVLDEELEPAPIGVTGELYIGGRGLARGYANNAERTAQVFIPNPFADAGGDRLYRTGDLARQRPDGTIVFLGRRDDQAKIRGQRVEPGEIETALLRHPAIREAAVVVRAEKSGDPSLTACLVTHGRDLVEVGVMREFLRRSLPPAMIPTAFVQLDTLPRTPSGKIDRSALVAVPERSIPRRGTAMPRDPLETRLAAVWEKVLGVVPIGIHDDFFDLGGHSFLAVALFSELERTLGCKLPLATLFEAPTIAQVANILRNQNREPAVSWSSLVPISPGGSRPPFYCVHAVGGNVLTYADLARHLGPDQPVYGLQAAGLDGRRSPHASVEAMARDYIAEIRHLQPSGPYALGGTSAGGLIAYEMARQLEASQEKVALLALFDTHGVRSLTVRPEVSAAQLKLYGLADRIRLHFENFLAANRSGKAAYVMEKSRRLEKRLRRRWADFRRQPLPPTLQRVETAVSLALASYAPGPYGGRVTLFRASRQPSGYRVDPTLGWEGLAAGGVEIHDVPGRHGALVYEPRVGPLAAALSACLDRAFSGGSAAPSR